MHVIIFFQHSVVALDLGNIGFTGILCNRKTIVRQERARGTLKSTKYEQYSQYVYFIGSWSLCISIIGNKATQYKTIQRLHRPSLTKLKLIHTGFAMHWAKPHGLFRAMGKDEKLCQLITDNCHHASTEGTFGD